LGDSGHFYEISKNPYCPHKEFLLMIHAIGAQAPPRFGTVHVLTKEARIRINAATQALLERDRNLGLHLYVPLRGTISGYKPFLAGLTGDLGLLTSSYFVQNWEVDGYNGLILSDTEGPDMTTAEVRLKQIPGNLANDAFFQARQVILTEIVNIAKAENRLNIVR
jgi:hypothetical protein